MQKDFALLIPAIWRHDPRDFGARLCLRVEGGWEGRGERVCPMSVYLTCLTVAVGYPKEIINFFCSVFTSSTKLKSLFRARKANKQIIIIIIITTTTTTTTTKRVLKLFACFWFRFPVSSSWSVRLVLSHNAKSSVLAYILWFNFSLGLKFIFLCFRLIIMHYHIFVYAFSDFGSVGRKRKKAFIK